MIQLRLSEALLSVGRAIKAGKSILRIVCQEINMTESIKTHVSGELLFSVFSRHI